MFKNLTTIIAGTLIALATGPAFAQSQNVPVNLDMILDALDTLQVTADESQNLVEPKTISANLEVIWAMSALQTWRSSGKCRIISL